LEKVQELFSQIEENIKKKKTVRTSFQDEEGVKRSTRLLPTTEIRQVLQGREITQNPQHQGSAVGLFPSWKNRPKKRKLLGGILSLVDGGREKRLLTK